MNEYDHSDFGDHMIFRKRPSGAPIRPIASPKVDIKMSKQVMREEYELLPFDISTNFIRNRVNVEYTDVDFAYLNSQCEGLYMFFNEHGCLGTQAIGFELETDMAMFVLKFQGTDG